MPPTHWKFWTGLSAVCDCGISWSYSLFFTTITITITYVMYKSQHYCRWCHRYHSIHYYTGRCHQHTGSYGRGCLRFVIVVFSDHTHLLFFTTITITITYVMYKSQHYCRWCHRYHSIHYYTDRCHQHTGSYYHYKSLQVLNQSSYLLTKPLKWNIELMQWEVAVSCQFGIFREGLIFTKLRQCEVSRKLHPLENTDVGVSSPSQEFECGKYVF